MLLLQDSLMPLAQYMQHALGSQHTVTSLVQKAAEANLSSATKARKQEQQKLVEVGELHPVRLVTTLLAMSAVPFLRLQPGKATNTCAL